MFIEGIWKSGICLKSVKGLQTPKEERESVTLVTRKVRREHKIPRTEIALQPDYKGAQHLSFSWVPLF